MEVIRNIPTVSIANRVLWFLVLAYDALILLLLVSTENEAVVDFNHH